MNTEQGWEILKNEGIFWSRLGFSIDPPRFDDEDNCILHEDPERYFKYHRDMTKAGVKVHTCILPTGWQDEGEYSFKTVSEIFTRLMEENPDIYFIPRIKLNPPVAWMKKNPEELFVVENGPKNVEEIRRLVGSDRHNTVGDTKEGDLLYNQSFSSKKWKREASVYLCKVIDLIEKSPYADRVIGYHLGYGLCGETHMWGNVKTLDFGINEKKRFYEFGMNKYKSKELLKEKWGVCDIDEGNVPIPKASERFLETGKVSEFFRGGDKYNAYLDYNLYRKEISKELVNCFSRIVKERTGKLVGIFHGYVLAGGSDRHGHTDLEEVLKSPYVDFLCAPKSYYRNGLGEPGGFYSPPLSINRKKLWIDEMDYPRDNKKTDEFIKILWREFAKDLSVGTPFWWMDLLGGWYDNEAVQKTVSRLIGLKKEMPRKRESIAEILLVIDEKSALFTTQHGEFQMKTMQESTAQVALSGMPYDMYRISELNELNLEKYKIIFFINCFQLSKEEKKDIDKRISKDTVLIFNHSFGIKGEEVSLDNVKCNTGFDVKEHEADTAVPYLEIAENENVEPIYTYHAAAELERNNPYCKFSDIPDNDKIAVAKRKREDGGINILAAAPVLDSFFIRKTAENAGCKEIAPFNTTVYGDSRFIAIFAYDNVRENIRLDGDFYNPVTKNTVGGELFLDMKKGDFVFLIRKT